MNGEVYREARESLGLSRRQVAELVGLTPAKIGRIESKGPLPEEMSLLAVLLNGEDTTTPTIVPPPPPPASTGRPLPEVPPSEGPASDPDAQIVLEEWRGIKKGDIVRVEGEKLHARFRFGHYFKNPAQEYVSVYSLKNGAERSVRPERIRTEANKIPKVSG